MEVIIIWCNNKVIKWCFFTFSVKLENGRKYEILKLTILFQAINFILNHLFHLTDQRQSLLLFLFGESWSFLIFINLKSFVILFLSLFTSIVKVYHQNRVKANVYLSYYAFGEIWLIPLEKVLSRFVNETRMYSKDLQFILCWNVWVALNEETEKCNPIRLKNITNTELYFASLI